MRKHALHNPYSEEIYLLYNCSQKVFAKYITSTYSDYKYENGKGADGHMEDPIDEDGIKTFYIWIDQNATKMRQRLATVHETGHLIIALFEYIQIPIKVECDEAFTYFQEYLCEQIYKKLGL